MNNKIVCVAIKVKDLVVSLPKPNRHHHIIHKLGEYGWLSTEIRFNGEYKQGFLDSYGNFKTREEAMVIAIQSGQIQFTHNKCLFSEDLW